VTILNSAVCFIAAPTAAVTAVSWLLTFTPWARFMPDAFFVPLFFLTFPLFGWSVFVLSVVRRLTWRLGLGKPVPAVPPGQDVLGAA